MEPDDARRFHWEPSDDLESLRRILNRALGSLDGETKLRFYQHLSLEFEIDYLVLKGHLLVQSAFADALELNFHVPHPEYLDKADIGFQQYLHLARAVVDAKVPKWAWEAARRLNLLRNDLAHRLESKHFDERLQEFLSYVIKHNPEISTGPTDKVRLFSGIMILYAMFVTPLGPDRERRLLSEALQRLIGDKPQTLGTLAKKFGPGS